MWAILFISSKEKVPIMYARNTLILLVSCLLFACQSTDKQTTVNSPTLLNDSLFPTYHLFAVETPDEIFFLDDDAKAFAERAVYEISISEKNPKRFAKSLFEHSDQNDGAVVYRNNANTVANSTFNNRSANCLSLSIMAYALAEHAGLDAEFYEIDIPEYWTRKDGYSLLNGHINLQVSVPDNPLLVSVGASAVTIDFDPQMLRSPFPRKVISKQKVLSMFYNNKGADALVANRYTRAYGYFRAAALMSPQLQQSWVNLGVLYRKIGELDQAELTYKHALSLNEDNLTAWENLSILYVHQGRNDEAMAITEMVETKRRTNPFYHFILGEQAFDEGALAQALSHYQRALRLDDGHHEILFGMAKVLHELGDIHQSQRYLQQALKQADNDQDKTRYTSKLAAIASS